MQMARYEAVIRYISEYQCIYVKNITNNPLQIKNIEMNLQNIELL